MPKKPAIEVPEVKQPVQAASSSPPLYSDAVARVILIGALLLLLLVQGFYLYGIRDRPNPLSDGFDEANALRAAEAYVNEGFSKHYGLARFYYGNRYPDEGGMDVRCVNGKLMPPAYRATPAEKQESVYIHYPTGAEFFCGMLASVFGLERIWVLRLVPLTTGLAAAGILVWTLRRIFGLPAAALFACGLATLPSFNLYLPGLSFQSYSFSLLLLELTLLVRLWWGPSLHPRRSLLGLFLLGFLQGWLTFDQCFVVTFAAVPFWLLARAENRRPSPGQLFLIVLVTGSGFTLAHLAHLWQVSLELGGMPLAVAEFTHTATARSAGDTSAMVLPDFLRKPSLAFLNLSNPNPNYFQCLLAALYSYVRYAVHPLALQFSPHVPLALILMALISFRGKIILGAPWTRFSPRRWLLVWPGAGSPTPAFLAAAAISLTWLFVMPAHTQGNSHFVVRHLLLFSVVALFILSRSLSAENRIAAASSS